jgi:hypothetical protein
MSRDYYAEALELAQILEAEGRRSDSKLLRDAIADGATGSEILMALRWHLKRIEEATSESDTETRSRIRDLSTAIGRALR